MTPAERFSLKDRYALVIGGTSGIGKAIATGFLQAGARVIVAGKNEEKLARAVGELKAHGDAFGYAADMRDDAAIHGLIGQVLAHHGHLDILVNCQGMTTLKPALEFTAADWDEVVATNLRSVFFACQEVGRHMVGRGKGCILNIGSLSSYRGWPRSALYGLAKTAVVSLTETLAAEWAPSGVRVNALAPGFVMTDLNRDKMAPERKALALARTPMGRFGEVEELVGAAIYLCSDAARFVTGETIRVDGGFLATGL
ncbi:MAG: SDR family oxidoreductase [Alphaproteobacteria bacterium]|nr:SDR family oxidoreductase [Alphaproteobacteria bacterium]